MLILNKTSKNYLLLFSRLSPIFLLAFVHGLENKIRLFYILIKEITGFGWQRYKLFIPKYDFKFFEIEKFLSLHIRVHFIINPKRKYIF